jgi:hypothetical protein
MVLGDETLIILGGLFTSFQLSSQELVECKESGSVILIGISAAAKDGDILNGQRKRGVSGEGASSDKKWNGSA